MSYVPVDTDAENRLVGVKSSSTVLEWCLKMAIALGTLLRIAWAGKRELWYDEVLSVLLASGQKNAYNLPVNEPFKVQDISQLLMAPASQGVAGSVEAVKDVLKGILGDPHPPLFYLGEHGWMRLFGTSETALRSLMVLISLLALGASYYLGRRILGDRGGLVFTALLSLNPFFLTHSLNLRMYAPMVLWVLVSGWCLLVLIETNRAETNRAHQTRKKWALRFGIAASLAAGLLTQYLFAYWLFSLAALALYLDRKHWFEHALTLGTGLLLFTPWALWGTRQQIHNRRDVFDQISLEEGPLQSALHHLQDVAQTLANHLLLGHLSTGMLPFGEPIKPTAVAIGCGVISFLAVCVVGLYRRRHYRILMISALMGLLPLALALLVDVAAGTFTLGFGWGRSIMVALPGCLLLVAAWLDLGTGRSRLPIIGLVLAVYLGVNVMDYGMRDRRMFADVGANLPAANEPVLIVMNSQAWGHVLRLAYYLEASDSAEVLATDAADGPEALATALSAKNYNQVLWLRSNDPLWGVTDVDVAAFADETEALLQDRYPGAGQQGPAKQALEGTMDLDSFTLQVYR